jgi:uncharacterized protein (TIGR02145 family)
MKHNIQTRLSVFILYPIFGSILFFWGWLLLFPQYAHATSCGSYSFTWTDGLTYGTVVGADGKCWLDRNLGATEVATAYNDYNAYGSIFQWGRLADGHQLMTWTSSSAGTPVYGATTTLSSTDNPGTNLFIEASWPYDWRSPANNNLWQGGVSAINNPCPTGFYVPTIAEWSTLIASSSITSIATAYSSALKLTTSGQRLNTGSFQGIGGSAQYWSSTINGTNADYMYYYGSTVSTAGNGYRSFGSNVRCVSDLSSFGPSVPTVTTSSPSPVSDTSATLNGNITATGGANATVRGFAYGTDSALNAVIATTTESGSFGTGAFSDFVFGLSCGTTYYDRTYATNSGGTGFGSIQSFNTSSCSLSPPTVQFFNGTIKFLNGSIKIL